MLSDNAALARINDAFSARSSDFSIHELLFLLKATCRIIGYVPLTKSINPNFHCVTLKERIERARALRNSGELGACRYALGRLAMCFAYLEDRLRVQPEEKAKMAALENAIRVRDDTTDEERVSEVTLLNLLINNKQLLLVLLAEYADLPLYENLTGANKKGAAQAASDVAPSKLVGTGETLRRYNNPKLIKQVIGQAVLADKKKGLVWFQENSWLTALCIKTEHQEQLAMLRQRVADYIAQRERESGWSNFFGCPSKSDKLAAARGFLEFLRPGQTKPLALTPKQHAALTADEGSRLCSLYRRYRQLPSAQTSARMIKQTPPHSPSFPIK